MDLLDKYKKAEALNIKKAFMKEYRDNLLKGKSHKDAMDNASFVLENSVYEDEDSPSAKAAFSIAYNRALSHGANAQQARSEALKAYFTSKGLD